MPNKKETNIPKLNLKELNFKEFNGTYVVNDDDYSWIESDSIDLVLTDPPFNIARDTNFHTYEKNTINSYRFDADKGWDSYSPEGFRELLKTWSIKFERVLRPGGSFAVFCADEYISDLITALREAGLKPRRTITWRKPNAVPVNRKHMMMSACEYIVTGVKGAKSVFNSDVSYKKNNGISIQENIAIADKAATVLEQEIRKRLSLLQEKIDPGKIESLLVDVVNSSATEIAKRAINIYQNNDYAELCIPNFVNFNSKSGTRLHPTEKPVNLLTYLINLFSNPGETILDPFSGSGSTGEAAIKSNRKAILVERDLEFFGKSINRLANLDDLNQGKLF